MSEAARVVFDASVCKAALRHHAARGQVVDEMVGPKGIEVTGIEAVVDDSRKGLGAVTATPVLAPYPVAHLGIVFADVDIALAISIEADAA